MFLKPSSSIVTGDAAETPGKFEPTLNSNAAIHSKINLSGHFEVS